MALQLEATDPDPLDTLRFTLVSGPDGIEVGETSGLGTWTPTEVQGPMVTNIVVAVTDDGLPSEVDATGFTVTVEEVHTAPVLTLPPDQVVRTGYSLTVPMAAEDADWSANTPLPALGGVREQASRRTEPRLDGFIFDPSYTIHDELRVVLGLASDRRSPAKSHPVTPPLPCPFRP